ncbi:MAG: hypothetical protein ABIZ04_20045 [Opitutus sp.]
MLNTWWRDVLQNGEHSPYARYFDIDWNSQQGEERSRVLVPILDDHYGRVLEAGRLSLVYEDAALSVAYGDMRFPVSPRTYRVILEAIAPSAARGRSCVDWLKVSAACHGRPLRKTWTRRESVKRDWAS